MMKARIQHFLPVLAVIVLAAAMGGCAEYGFNTSISSAAAKSLKESIQKEFDLMVQDFDALDAKGEAELCTPLRFAVARFAVYQAIEEGRKTGMAQMTRFITRARRALTSTGEKLKSRKCVDSDGDGLTDLAEVRRYKTNPNNADTDADGLADGLEVRRHRTNPLNFDTDGDLLSDGEEAIYFKVSPNHPDSDRDGYTDGFEVTRGTDPGDQCSRPVRGPRAPGPWAKCKLQKEFDLMVRDFDALDGKGELELCAPLRFAVARFAVYQAIEEGRKSGMEQMTRFILQARRALTAAREKLKSRKCTDSDGDGLTDLAEVRLYKTNPNNADTDADGLADGLEVRRHRTNPLNFDTDGDLLSDGEEAIYFKVSPKHPDSDRDGYTDGFEVTRGTDPGDQCSRPVRGPRAPGPWAKCKRSLTGKRYRRRRRAVRRPVRREGENPLINESITHNPLNP